MTLEDLKANHPELITQIEAGARATEKKRFEDILGSEEAKGREKLAQEIALGTELNHVEASQLLACASPDVKANVSDFESAMASTKNPDIQPESEQQDDDIDAVAQRIANMS